MKKLKKILNSLSFKIWRMVMGILLLFIICLVLINGTLLKHSKEDFIYQQLRMSSEAKKSADNEKEVGNDDEVYESPGGKQRDQLNSLTTTFVNHFVLFWTTDGYQAYADGYTSKLYIDEYGKSDVIEAISGQVIKGIKKEQLITQGKIEVQGATHFYYVDYSNKEERLMVFLTSVASDDYFPPEYGIAFIIVLMVSFVASQMITKKIVKPIKELENFSEEVALHHWEVQTPTSDTTEIQQLADSLNQMRNTLKTTEERERQFLQSSSHNLKTPVMIIKGYAQALIDGVNIESKSSAAQVIRLEAESLERRIVQLLKLNTYGHTLERDKRQEYIRIDRLIKSLVTKLKMVRPELDWELNLQELEIMGNSDALLTAFENLVENQLRFAKSTIMIEIKIGQAIEILFSNDGPPFETEDPMSLFERYKKDKEGQFGLGLAIVKQIIEGHEGRIEASNHNEGVIFKISLPLSIRSLFTIPTK